MYNVWTVILYEISEIPLVIRSNFSCLKLISESMYCNLVDYVNTVVVQVHVSEFNFKQFNFVTLLLKYDINSFFE